MKWSFRRSAGPKEGSSDAGSPRDRPCPISLKYGQLRVANVLSQPAAVLGVREGSLVGASSAGIVDDAREQESGLGKGPDGRVQSAAKLWHAFLDDADDRVNEHVCLYWSI